MIRLNKLTLMSLLLLSSYFLVACHSPHFVQSTAETAMTSETTTTQETSPSTDTLPKIISDHEQNGIQYPVFTENDIGTPLNTLIEQAIPTISEQYPNQHFQYTVSLLNASYLSLIFDADITDGAYPHHALSTLNINLVTLTPLKLSDVVPLDDAFYTQLEREVTSTLADLTLPPEALSFSNIKERINQLETSSSHDTQFYLTDNQLTLLFEVPHVLGDTFTINIPY